LLESFLLLFENEISLVLIILNRPLVDVLLLEVSLCALLPEFYCVLNDTFRVCPYGIKVCSNTSHYNNLIALTLVNTVTVLTLVYLGNCQRLQPPPLVVLELYATHALELWRERAHGLLLL
jgi:hypothetical protein